MNLVSMVINWIKNASEKNTQLLAETMLIYHGVGRGSGHAFLWYSEVAWDSFFTAAHTIGAHKALICIVSVDNRIVSRIMNAARDSKIDDALVHMTDGPRWNAVLHEWPRKIEAYVKSINTEMFPENVLLSQQLSGALSIFQRLEKKVDRMSDFMQDPTSDSNSIQLMQENMQLQNTIITLLKKENKGLQHKLAALMNLSPFSSPPSKRAAEAALSPSAGIVTIN
jgi:hypothetical protein